MIKQLNPSPQWGKKKPVKNTDNFIETFITPKSDYPVKDLFEIFRWSRFVDNDWIKSIINELPYDSFLQSRYWENVRLYKFAKAHYRCESCGCCASSDNKLNVHHKTYENHGLEHTKEVADKDLIVLCHKCHKLTHLRGGTL